MKRILVFAVLISVWSNKISAQFDAMFTQYMFNESFINPAYAGSKEALSLTALHRQQWMNFSGRPVTSTFSAHAPVLNNNFGVGVNVLKEKIGVLYRNLIYFNIAYRVKLSEKAKLSFGLMGGLHTQRNNFSELQTTDINDVEFSGNTPVVPTANAGTGLYYYTDKFYCGFSIPRLIHDNINYTGAGEIIKTQKIDPANFHYFFTIGRVFTINSDLKIKPQALLKMVKNAPVQSDLNLNFLISDKLWLGAGYRSGSNISALVGLNINKQFTVNYSYDYVQNQMRKYNNGSHEISLNYLFAFKQQKIVSNRYF